MAVKICLICNKKFETNYGVQKFCYDSNCKRIAQLNRVKKYHKSHKVEVKEMNKNWIAENIEKVRKNKREYNKKNREMKNLSDKKYREKNKHLSEYKLKCLARTLCYNDRKKNSHLYSKECMICGETKNVQQHHPLYSFPYNVYPVCPVHHAEIHKNDSKVNI